jgi:nucleoside-diphosphate-sugar epimerase
MARMRTAMVTGATGFVGLHVVERLVVEGWRVVALHRTTSKLDLLRRFPVELAVGSLDAPDTLLAAIPEGCDAVFHVAGNTSFWSANDLAQTRDNVDGTRNVVEAAIARGAKSLVYTSSVSAYGRQDVLPFDETAKSTALTSTVNYERTKYLGELEVDKGVARGLRATILNPGHILGKYDVRGWSTMIQLVATGKLPGIPPGSGSFADARQVARAHVAAVDRGQVGGRYLLGGTDATYVEMVRIVGEITGRPVPKKAMPRWVLATYARFAQLGSFFTGKQPTVTPELIAAAPCSIRSDKAVHDLGYEAVPLAEMIRESYEWLRAAGIVTSPSAPATARG